MSKGRTVIRYQKDMEAELKKLKPKLERLKLIEQSLEVKMNKAIERYEDVKKRAHRVSEEMAAKRGLISQCKDGKVVCWRY